MDLLSLPPEVLYQVFDVFREDGDIDSLRSSLLVCRAMQGVVEHALYHTIAFRKRSSMQMLARALKADSRRLRYIQDLQLQWSTHDYNHGEIQPPDLAAMLNLRRLLSESPECQPWSVRKGEWKPDMQICLDAFEKASLRSTLASPKPLEHLLSLTLHWSGDNDRFWSAKPSCPIFLHPTLREIKISCVSIVGPEDDNDAEWAAGLAVFRHKTALESLHFEESLVSPRALETILSLPRALKQFKFHEVSHHRPSVARFLDELIGSDFETLGTALEQQSGSLEYLGLHTSAYSRRPRAPLACFVLSLAIFRNLKTIELGHHSNRRSESIWMLARPLPPYLEHLRVTEFCPNSVEAVDKSLVAMLRVDELIRNAQALGHTFHLEIWLPSIHYSASLSLDANFLRFEPILRALDGTILAGRKMPYLGGIAEESQPNTNQEEGETATPQPWPWPRVSIISVKKMGYYIPPYLHGEMRPVLTPLFDSHDGWLSKALLDSYEEEVQRGMNGEPGDWELVVQNEEEDGDDGEGEENDDDDDDDDEVAEEEHAEHENNIDNPNLASTLE